MKILFDELPPARVHPLSRNDVKKLIMVIPNGIVELISEIRFSCNTKTTQEGRVVKRGETFNIRINFTLENMRSPLLTNKGKWLAEIKRLGGKLPAHGNQIFWSYASARQYACFLLCHEVAHIEYIETRLGGRIDLKSSSAEENWCDKRARDLLARLQ